MGLNLSAYTRLKLRRLWDHMRSEDVFPTVYQVVHSAISKSSTTASSRSTS